MRRKNGLLKVPLIRMATVFSDSVQLLGAYIYLIVHLLSFSLN